MILNKNSSKSLCNCSLTDNHHEKNFKNIPGNIDLVEVAQKFEKLAFLMTIYGVLKFKNTLYEIYHVWYRYDHTLKNCLQYPTAQLL